MSPSTVLILFLVGIVASIVIGNKLKFNIGLVAMVFAYAIGVFGLGMKTSALIEQWPTKVLFIIIGICWLFGYANENGTLKQITLVLVHKFQKYPSIIPFPRH